MHLDPLAYELGRLEQTSIEREMCFVGQSKLAVEIKKALESGLIMVQPWAKKLIDSWYYPILGFLEAHRNDMGQTNPLIHRLDVLGAETVALLAVRLALHTGLSNTKAQRVPTVGKHWGMAICNEFSMTLEEMLVWDDPKSEDRLLDVTETKRAFRNILKPLSATRSKWLRNQIGTSKEFHGNPQYLIKPSKQDLWDLGMSLVSVVLLSTNLLEKTHKVVWSDDYKTEGYVVLTDDAKQKLEGAVDAAMLFPPVSHWPMVIPPKRWGPGKKGGYLTGSVRTHYRFVSTPKGGRGHKPSWISQRVYDAVNTVQDTPFSINNGVLGVIQEALSNGLVIPKFEHPNSVMLPDPPADKDDKEAWKRYYAEKSRCVSLRDTLKGNYMASMAAVGVAERFSQYERIYFPHTLDFRGRMYPLASNLSPQGGSVSKGLLELGYSKQVGDRGLYWLKVHAANLYGVDKVPLQDRVQWFEDNLEDILRVAEDPLGTIGFWGEADSPYQFLGLCLEAPGMVKDGPKHKSKIFVQKDGSCNGLQHLSAISRDPKTARLVNLVDGSVPKDVYGVVAEDTTKKLKDILEKGRREDDDEALEDRDMAAKWLEFGVDRKVTKRPVMTLPYGSTLFATGDFIAEVVVDKLGVELPNPFTVSIPKASGWLKNHLWGSIGETIPGARRTMDWLKGAAKAASDANKGVSWTTPDGMVCHQHYVKADYNVVTLRAFGITHRAKMVKHGGELNKRKQQNAIAPNFIHSLDAAHLRMYVNEAKAKGVDAFVMIHDSYGCHAADVDTMDAVIRETFVQMYREDVTQPLLQSLEEQGTPYDDPMVVGDLDITEVLRATYFFA